MVEGAGAAPCRPTHWTAHWAAAWTTRTSVSRWQWVCRLCLPNACEPGENSSVYSGEPVLAVKAAGWTGTRAKRITQVISPLLLCFIYIYELMLFSFFLEELFFHIQLECDCVICFNSFLGKCSILIEMEPNGFCHGSFEGPLLSSVSGGGSWTTIQRLHPFNIRSSFFFFILSIWKHGAS